MDEAKTAKANAEAFSGLGCKEKFASKCESKGVTTFKFTDDKCLKSDAAYTPKFVKHGECFLSNGGSIERNYMMYRYVNQKGSSAILLKATISALVVIVAS